MDVHLPSRALFQTRNGLSTFALTGALLLAAALVACNNSPSTGAPSAPGAGKAPPPAEVGVITVATGDVGLVTELPGRLEASRVAQVRARAAGILQKRLFREGSDVKAGQVLFSIDAAPYAALSASARAGLAKAEANASQTSALADRYKTLVDVNAVSKQEYANAVAAQKQAQADVAVAKANVQTAGINLGYASVTSPISGRIGRALVTEGALVGQGEATQLAVVQQINPLYVNFTQSAADVMKLKNAMASGQFLQANSKDAASVRVVLEDGTEYAKPARLLFSDLTVDASTGQVTLRAEVPNPNGDLLPGLFVRVRLEQSQARDAVMLPQQAVTRTAQGDSVTVVGKDGKVSPRPVKLGSAKGSDWVVLSGLQNGEQVMVDGFQKLQPNAVVKPVPWQALASQAAASAPASTTATATATAPAPVPAASAAPATPAASAPQAAK